jgi:hypothetical protein
VRLRIPLLVVCLFVASGLVVLTVATRTGNSDARQAGQANLWPAFEMEYVYQQFDTRTGKIIVDETHVLTVTSEWQFRDEIVRDEVDPRRAGSYHEFRNGIYYSYDASLRNLRELHPDPNSIVLVNRILDPTLLSSARVQKAGGGWLLQSQAQPVTTAVQRISGQCPGSQGLGECEEELFVEWETKSPGVSFRGGIPHTRLQERGRTPDRKLCCPFPGHQVAEHKTQMVGELQWQNMLIR